MTWLILGHLFGLYNPNQLADALSIPKSMLYSHLASFSCYQWKRLLLEVGCNQAKELIEQAEAMSDATKSRRRITLSVDDTVQERRGKVLSYCYNWYSGRFHKTWGFARQSGSPAIYVNQVMTVLPRVIEGTMRPCDHRTMGLFWAGSDYAHGRLLRA